MNRKETDFTKGSLYKKIFIFTIPIIISNIIQLLFNAADMIVVGRFCGSNSLAAVGSTTSLISLIISLFNGISVGAGVIISQYYGAKNAEKVRKGVHTAIIMALFFGIVLIFVGIFLSRRLLIIMKSPDDVINLSSLYLTIYFLCMPGFMIYTFGSSILRAVGDSRHPLYYLIICGFINVLINLLLVIVFNMDVAGVAVATAISQYLSGLLVIIRLIKEPGMYQLRISYLKPDLATCRHILKVGIPIGLQSIAMPVSNVLIQTSINSFGAIVVAGNAAAVSIENMIYAAIKSINQALITVTGQNYGARNKVRIVKAFHFCMIYAALTGTLLGIIVNVFGYQLINIYTTDTDAISIGLLRLTYVCLPYAICGFMEITNAVLSGIGITVPSMIMSVIGVSGVRILWLFTVFAISPSLICLYISYPVSWAVTFIAQYICFKIVWKRMLL